MKLRVPQYFKEFHCISDKCKDNCCIGWEIDIDDETANIYNKVSGEFGEKLQKNITATTPKSFILDKHDRCPFLNNKNLCEIFINLGEKNLCQICTEHPRYYEWFNNIKEGGIGLCCEEASRIILSQNTEFITYDINIPFESADEYDSNLYVYLQCSRNKIISHLDNTSLSLNSRIRNVLMYAHKLQENIDNNDLSDIDITFVQTNKKTNLQPILEFFLTLEPFDINWITYLKNNISLYNNSINKLEEFENTNSQISNYLQNISIYFVWRYFLKGVFDLDILSKIKLMAVSIAVIKFLFFCKWLENATLTFNDCVKIAKDYSKEIEYSDDNLSALVDAYYELDSFSVENLIGLFS
ncbi:MAG: flagellin lysine-N-methylase [Clostridia bacterium]|nr:flagellin lysine-N-methylase [Clostridia bacterium]